MVSGAVAMPLSALRPWWVPGVLCLWVGLLVLACDREYPDNQYLCDEAAIAAAQRSFECAESTDRANEAHDSLAALPCQNASEPASNAGGVLACVQDFQAIDCEVVKQHPGDPRQGWAPSSCLALFGAGAAGAGGSF